MVRDINRVIFNGEEVIRFPLLEGEERAQRFMYCRIAHLAMWSILGYLQDNGMIDPKIITLYEPEPPATRPEDV